MRSEKILIVFLVSFLCLLTFVLRIPLFYVPLDAGYEYWLAFLGRQVVKGGGFYSTPWGMKPPGEPLTYGLLYLLAGSENWVLAVRIFSAILASLATFIIFLLGRILFNSFVGILAALFWAVFSSGVVFYGTAAYAEMFMPLFTLLGFYLFFLSKKRKERKLLFFSGISLGVSLFYKQSALYCFLPLFLYSLGGDWLSRSKKNLKEILTFNFPLPLGFLLPLTVFVVYIFLQGRFPLFWECTVLKPRLYCQFRERHWIGYMKSIFSKSFIVWLLAFGGILGAFFRDAGRRFLLILWILFTSLTFITSGKFWNYYFLQPFLPATLLAAVFVGDLFSLGKGRLPLSSFWLKNSLVAAVIILSLYHLYPLNFNYQRYFAYLDGKMNKEEYILSLSEGKREKERREAAQFLKQTLKKEDKVFIWDDYHAIYILADIMPLYSEYVWSQQFWLPKKQGIGFVFMYDFQDVKSNQEDLIKKLSFQLPEYIVFAIDPVEIEKQKEIFPQFFLFVSERYNLLERFGDIEVYQRLGQEKEKNNVRDLRGH